MSHFNLHDEIWWFYTDSSSGNVYPNWLNLCKGTIVWLSPYEEILHVYISGESNVFIVLDDKEHIFSSKQKAIDAMMSRISNLMESES